MSAFKKLFKQTAIYGLATVMPRMLSFLLVRIHTDSDVLQSVADYGVVSKIYAWFVIFNVILAYGMETAFFRFYHKEKNKENIVSTSTTSLLFSSVVFLILGLLFKEQIAYLTNLKVEYITLVVWILMLDALVIIPFAWLRAMEKPMRYAVIKILNVVVNLGLNIFFLLFLEGMAAKSSFWNSIYIPNFEINYIFIANLIASTSTLALMLPFYVKVQYQFDKVLWKKMLKYAFPVLIAGIAFSINEAFDRLLLDFILPKDISETAIGMYSACYKLGLFMMLFATAYRLGIEPYFFSHASSDNPQKNYAKILEFFVIFGSVILLVVVVFADVLKVIFIGDEVYWEAMSIVPIILMANFCLGIYHNLSVWYKITDRTKFGAYISVAGAIITLILNFALIPIISYKGSAIATLAAYGSMMLLSFYFGRKYYPIPYNLKKIGLYMLVSVLLSVLIFYVFNRNLYIGTMFVLLFLLMILLLEKNELKKILKRT
ncbi:polysaccharide biosynthesis C-terminal domain-containing protein [Galbibacter sp. EGI 63066]|uniref:lipopolysaccharide biosynthesis protein n=1 Tax=Galbibacter sp. EGI 63066 TaxID=2993559 RepID=UPI0022496AE0|nr:polysaccharide biosynthesis C-terminal domain-containing protein [Galbibacter sp. EGI 63066]MCX2681193.1 polysaccharide biosynthesis C-terminal domain-containing protein [Galbibacter sp. EGI 63066]